MDENITSVLHGRNMRLVKMIKYNI